MALSVVWGLVVAGAVGGPAETRPAMPQVPRQYQLECRITKADGEGGRKVLAQPRLVTLAGKSASFLTGGEFAAPAADGKAQFVEMGLRMDLLVLEAEGGKLRLDVTARDIRPGPAAGGGVRIHTRSVRAIEVVGPKERVKLKVGPYTFEVQAQPMN